MSNILLSQLSINSDADGDEGRNADHRTNNERNPPLSVLHVGTDCGDVAAHESTCAFNRKREPVVFGEELGQEFHGSRRALNMVRVTSLFTGAIVDSPVSFMVTEPVKSAAAVV